MQCLETAHANVSRSPSHDPNDEST